MKLVFVSLMLLALGTVFLGGWYIGGTPLSGVFAIAGAILGAAIGNAAGIYKLMRNRRRMRKARAGT